MKTDTSTATAVHQPRIQRTASPVIFLDIDGVLISRESYRLKLPGERPRPTRQSIAALNHVTDKTAAVFVISSTWRIGYKLIELRELLANCGLTGKVIDVTPRLLNHQGDICLSRGEEIQAWLNANSGTERAICIIDDEDDMGDTLRPSLVRTNFETGITMADGRCAVARLGRMARAAPGEPAKEGSKWKR